MPNVNAPTHVAEFGVKHGIDLAPYHEAVGDLQRLIWIDSDGNPKAFINVEIPFAEHVLFQLQSGAKVDDAVASGIKEALDSRDA